MAIIRRDGNEHTFDIIRPTGIGMAEPNKGTLTPGRYGIVFTWPSPEGEQSLAVELTLDGMAYMVAGAERAIQVAGQLPAWQAALDQAHAAMDEHWPAS